MLIYGPSGTRNFPTDRSPLTIAASAGIQQTGGGVSQTLALYTVPALRRATLVAHGNSVVSIAFAAGQVADLQILVTPSGGAQADVASQRRVGSALDQVFAVFAEPVEVRAGDQVLIRVGLSAGAGQVTSYGGLEGIEYDA